MNRVVLLLVVCVVVVGLCVPAEAGLFRCKRVVTIAPAWEAPTLSQMAVRALRATSGVTSVLVGMRTVDYVADVIADLYRPVDQAPFSAAWRELAGG